MQYPKMNDEDVWRSLDHDLRATDILDTNLQGIVENKVNATASIVPHEQGAVRGGNNTTKTRDNKGEMRGRQIRQMRCELGEL